MSITDGETLRLEGIIAKLQAKSECDDALLGEMNAMIEGLKVERDTLKYQLQSCNESHGEIMGLCERVMEERDALKFANRDLQDWYDDAIADAKRYNFIATGNVHIGPCRNGDGTIDCCYVAVFPNELNAMTPADLTAFIDKAMEAEHDSK